MRFWKLPLILVLTFGPAIRFARAESLVAITGDIHVTATAISSSIIRVSIADGAAAPIQSIFIDPALKIEDTGKVSDKAGHRLLSTDQATFDFDPATGNYSLLDGHGNVLIPPSPLATARANVGEPELDVHIGWPEARKFEIYGCGNGSNSLIQTSVKPRVGNGIAVQPFFWAPSGFATFVLGADDNAPAQCDGKVQNAAVTWAIPGNSADFYLIAAPTLSDAAHALLHLTGLPPVPPKWAFGYMQSRWGWADRAYIEDTLQQFINRKLPIDVFIIDFEWYTTTPDYELKPEGVKGFSDFDFSPKLFPYPAAQIKQLHDAGIHFVGIRKPRLGNSDTLAMLRAKGWVSSAPKGLYARGLRFSNPDVRTWYAGQLQPYLQAGVDGWWNDEGEFTYSNYVYWNMAERQALDTIDPARRLWTINRAFQPGTSRLGAAAWSGDIHATWKDLHRTPATLLNWSLAGEPYGACDSGGFSGQVTPELLVRWMEAGTFFPVMRAHSDISVKPHFPWLYGEEAESAIRKALDLRYQLVPVLYSLSHENHETGEPLMRPLVMEYPADEKVADLSTEWLIGQNILAAPVLDQGGHRTIYLPDDIWWDFKTGERVRGNQEIVRDVPLDQVPIYIRGGAILPLAPVVQHTRDLPGGPLDLQIFPGQDGQFTLTEDDGATNAYLAGNIRQTTFTWNDAAKTLSWTRAGNYDVANCFKTMVVTVHGAKGNFPGELPLTLPGTFRLTK
jgi:alpha-glucosidase